MAAESEQLILESESRATAFGFVRADRMPAVLYVAVVSLVLTLLGTLSLDSGVMCPGPADEWEPEHAIW